MALSSRERVIYATVVLAIVVAAEICLHFLGATPHRKLGGDIVGHPQNNRSNPHVAETDLYIRTENPLEKEYPELFATNGIIVSFGAEWCAACRRQVLELKGPSNRYNIIKATIEDPTGAQTRWSRLMDLWDLGDTIPVTVVVSKGKILHTVYGYTPWDQIRPNAEKAKKNDNDEKGNIKIGPIHIDWDVDPPDNRRPPRP